MRFPLAICSADHGLAWHFREQEISLPELNCCRTAFGNLPDFDYGDKGFEGIAVRKARVFVVRCFMAPNWDFMGRNALYIAVTWMPVAQLQNVEKDVTALLQLPYFQQPMRDPPSHFEWSPSKEDVPESYELIDGELKDGLILRREIGKSKFISVCNPITQAEPPEPFVEPTNTPTLPVPKETGSRLSANLWWVIGIALGLVLLAVLAYAATGKKGIRENDRSRETIVGRESIGNIAETNEIPRRADALATDDN